MKAFKICFVIFILGCGGDHDHGPTADHHHHAPHDGTLIVFGDEFAHVELVLDTAAGNAIAYVLDGEAEEAVRVEQPAIELVIDGETVVLSAVPNTLTGETVGNTSQFEGRSEAFRRSNFEASLVALNVRGMNFNNVAFRFPEGNE